MGSTAPTVLFDLDGTIYLGGVLYPGVVELIDKLTASGMQFGFLTNNSTVGPETYARRLRALGLKVGRRHILTSAEATCLMLDEMGLGPGLYIVGTRAFRRFLASRGFRHTFDEAQAVLVGFDTELTYRKLSEATQLLLERDLPLVASHPDPVCPGPLPDAGMLLAYFQAADPRIAVKAIAGKPHRWIMELVQRRFSCEPREVIMVGDRHSTDVRFAQTFGMRSILVLNGGSPPAPDIQPRPDVIAPAIGQLIDTYWPPDLCWT